MNIPETKKPQNKSVRQSVLLGLFAGTAVGAGYLLSSVPNVELMSLIVALSGAVLGPLGGSICGVLAGAIFSLGNPFGPPPPLLLLAQVMGHGFMGFAGWFWGRKILKILPEHGRVKPILYSVAVAIGGTLLYELLTNLAIVAMFEDASLKVILIGAIPYSLIHVGVNTLLFVMFFPLLVRRLGHAAEAPLVGRSALVLLLIGMGAFSFAPSSVCAQGAPTDSLSAALPDSLLPAAFLPEPEGLPNGWKRPLWVPFSSSMVSWLDKHTHWIPVVDGGLGSSTMILGEATTSPAPTILRDGIPQGTGHIVTDDPQMVSNQGLVFVQQKMGRDWAGGTDGMLNLGTDEKDMTKAVSFYRGVKGPHESYMRGISLLTPKTAWRLGFEFDESIDREGYNYTESPDDIFFDGNEFRGHSSIRRSRTRLIRHLDEDNSLSLEYSTSRKTKDDLPALGAEHQEIWSDGAAATARSRKGDWVFRSSLFWNSRTAEWGDRPVGITPSSNVRKLESGREGMVVDLIHVPQDSSKVLPEFQTDAGLRNEDFQGPGTGLRLLVKHWDLHDDGVTWDTLPSSASSGDGTEARLAARTGLGMGFARLNFGVFGDYQDRAGVRPGGFVALQQAPHDSWWKLVLESGGRAPRSDELLTPLLHSVAIGDIQLLPNSDLKHENTLRANLLLNIQMLGFDFAFDASARRLRDGITWVADEGETKIGHWQNQLDMNSSRLTASIARQGRFLGWGRARLEGTWQKFDETGMQAAFLPPEKYLRLELMWEQHFFEEDGILQLALLTTHRGEMNDPWDVTRNVVLPSSTLSDLLVGFRLVGTNISLNFRNVTDQRVRLSSASLSPGREMDLRLHWVFLY